MDEPKIRCTIGYQSDDNGPRGYPNRPLKGKLTWTQCDNLAIKFFRGVAGTRQEGRKIARCVEHSAWVIGSKLLEDYEELTAEQYLAAFPEK